MKNKSKISIIMASSLDGKITLPNVEKFKFTSIQDRSLLLKMRSQYDCVIIGANTVRKGGHPSLFESKNKNQNQPTNVLLNTNLKFNLKKNPYFEGDSIKRIIFTTKDTPKIILEKFGGFGKVIVVSKDENKKVNVKQVYDILTKKYGFKKILLEGGGLLNQSFLRNDLVDDIYLTVCPIIVGAKSSRSFVEGSDVIRKNVKKLKLINCKIGKFGEIFLHYNVEKNKKIKLVKKKFGWRME